MLLLQAKHQVHAITCAIPCGCQNSAPHCTTAYAITCVTMHVAAPGQAPGACHHPGPPDRGYSVSRAAAREGAGAYLTALALFTQGSTEK
eukprot:1155386-Pelagomonas_calceolata.AAC.4